MPSNQRTASITGVSRGIGRSIALNLAGCGFAVVVNHAHSPREAHEAIDAISATGGRAVAIRADVSFAAEVRRLFDEASNAFGGIDALVNNAGVTAPTLLRQADEDQFEHQFAVNVRGTFNALREAANRLRDHVRVVNLSSTTVALNAPGYGIYNATKR